CGAPAIWASPSMTAARLEVTAFFIMPPCKAPSPPTQWCSPGRHRIPLSNAAFAAGLPAWEGVAHGDEPRQPWTRPVSDIEIFLGSPERCVALPAAASFFRLNLLCGEHRYKTINMN